MVFNRSARSLSEAIRDRATFPWWITGGWRAGDGSPLFIRRFQGNYFCSATIFFILGGHTPTIPTMNTHYRLYTATDISCLNINIMTSACWIHGELEKFPNNEGEAWPFTSAFWSFVFGTPTWQRGRRTDAHSLSRLLQWRHGPSLLWWWAVKMWQWSRYLKRHLRMFFLN